MTSQFIKSTLAMEHHQINKMMADHFGIPVVEVDSVRGRYLVSKVKGGEEVEYNPCCDCAGLFLMQREHKLTLAWLDEIACVGNGNFVVQHNDLGKAICVAVLCGGV